MAKRTKKATMKDHTGPCRDGIITIVKVGTSERPASEDDIKAVVKELAAAKREKRTPVLHHMIDTVAFQPGYAMVLVGTDERPAGPADVKDMAKCLRTAIRDAVTGQDTCVVTHHAIDVKSCQLVGNIVPCLGHSDGKKVRIPKSIDIQAELRRIKRESR